MQNSLLESAHHNIKVKVSGGIPECGSECWDATEEGEGNDDEEEGEEGWHVVAGAATLPCQSKALLTPGHITHHTATSRVHLKKGTK